MLFPVILADWFAPVGNTRQAGTPKNGTDFKIHGSGLSMILTMVNRIGAYFEL
jgi:hypothetical protein